MTSPTRNLLTLSLIGAIVAAAVYSTGLFFLRVKMRAIEENTALLTIVEKSALGKRELQRTVADTADERARLSAAVLTEDAVPDFINGLEKLAADAGTTLSVSSVTVSSSKDLSYHEFVEAKLLAEGSLEEVYLLLSLLETVPGIRLQAAEFDRSEDGNGKSIWRIGVALLVPKAK